MINPKTKAAEPTAGFTPNRASNSQPGGKACAGPLNWIVTSAGSDDGVT
jgi:hypothetical protein